ncbi:uroporphyrinogen-III synthase [Azospirillum halopraeferens]|uniref:uroporphyrinogen-III synthase n=1 Tax=Azospirillum halopraeferens TaxID=34010 RepID=UPI0004045183|nr:uroporphyrinogen-III synthase [Azospirillum halopraeferens]
MSDDRTRVLITRPAEDAAPLARRLAALGYEASVEPMLDIAWLDGPEPGLDGVRALLFTSANGVRAFIRRTARRERPVYAVGDATARAAADAGFRHVESAGGDVYALADLVARRCPAGEGPLLHVAGTVVAGDLAGLLGEKGFVVRREAMYEALPSAGLTARTAHDLDEGHIRAVLIFSPRTARSFVSLVGEAGLIERCRTVDLLCLSPAVAEAARTCGEEPVPWRCVQVAERPEQDSLLALLPDRSGGAA